MFPGAKVRKVERRTKQILLFFIPRRSTFATKWQRYGKSGAIQKNLFFFLPRHSPFATNRNRFLSFIQSSGKPLPNGGSREENNPRRPKTVDVSAKTLTVSQQNSRNVSGRGVARPRGSSPYSLVIRTRLLRRSRSRGSRRTYCQSCCRQMSSLQALHLKP